MPTTIDVDIDDDVYAAAEEIAKAQQKSVEEVLSNLIREGYDRFYKKLGSAEQPYLKSGQ